MADASSISSPAMAAASSPLADAPVRNSFCVAHLRKHKDLLFDAPLPQVQGPCIPFLRWVVVLHYMMSIQAAHLTPVQEVAAAVAA